MKKRLFALLIIASALPSFAQDDSLSFKHQIENENAITLRQFVAEPRVVAKKTVPRKDFYLYFSHLDWFLNGETLIAPVQDSEEIYFTSNDNILFSSHVDSTLWSAPEMTSQYFENAGPEAYPNVSYNGRALYFSSRTLFGIGGYDIYRCERNPQTGDLGEPQNMGYPFNSSADDLLCSETPDGRYIMFASNRACGPNDITIYVVEYENYTRKAVSESKVRELSQLNVVGSQSYPFTKGSLAQVAAITFQEAEPQFDYTFKVDKEGSFAEDNTLPEGIIYQIQLFVSSSKPSVKQLKGISPVFDHKQPSGKHLYAAGLFRTFGEAQSALSKVKKAGFSSAYIIAYKSGKSISVKNARAAENAVTIVEEEVRIVK